MFQFICSSLIYSHKFYTWTLKYTLVDKHLNMISKLQSTWLHISLWKYMWSEQDVTHKGNHCAGLSKPDCELALSRGYYWLALMSCVWKPCLNSICISFYLSGGSLYICDQTLFIYNLIYIFNTYIFICSLACCRIAWKLQDGFQLGLVRWGGMDQEKKNRAALDKRLKGWVQGLSHLLTLQEWPFC